MNASQSGHEPTLELTREFPSGEHALTPTIARRKSLPKTPAKTSKSPTRRHTYSHPPQPQSPCKPLSRKALAAHKNPVTLKEHHRPLSPRDKDPRQASPCRREGRAASPVHTERRHTERRASAKVPQKNAAAEPKPPAICKSAAVAARPATKTRNGARDPLKEPPSPGRRYGSPHRQTRTCTPESRGARPAEAAPRRIDPQASRKAVSPDASRPEARACVQPPEPKPPATVSFSGLTKPRSYSLPSDSPKPRIPVTRSPSVRMQHAYRSGSSARGSGHALRRVSEPTGAVSRIELVGRTKARSGSCAPLAETYSAAGLDDLLACMYGGPVEQGRATAEE